MKISSDLARDIQREVLKDSYYEFFKFFFRVLHNGQNFSDNFHIKYLCDILQEELERMLRNEEKDKDLLVNIPPRTSKSLIFSVFFPAWAWIKAPWLKFITVSFDAQLALVNSQFSRDVIASPEFQELFGDTFQVRPDIDSKGYFANNFGGYRLSRTTGQNVTGFSGHIIICDDMDSAMSVHQKTEREYVHKYTFEALWNRLTPADLGFRCFIAQRLHEEDISGILLAKNKDNFTHICLPAELSPNINPPELAEYYSEEGLLDPVRLNKSLLDMYKSTLGTKSYTGQYLQAPAPDEGGIFKKDWFDIVSPVGLERDNVNNPIHFILDTAYTDKQENDPSAIMTCFLKQNTLYILDVHEVWLEFPELIKHLQSHVLKYQYSTNSKIYIEPKASGKSLVQQLRASTNLNVIEIDPPKDSKITRANAVSPICEAKRVKLVDGVYVKNFLDQVAAFPNALHDDMVDDLIYAIQRLLKNNNAPAMVFLNL